MNYLVYIVFMDFAVMVIFLLGMGFGIALGRENLRQELNYEIERLKKKAGEK